jgi:hypothetical protein
MLRMGYHLLASLPDKAAAGRPSPPEARFDAAGRGTHDSAALALMPETGSFLLSRNGDGAPCLGHAAGGGDDQRGRPRRWR